MIKERLTDTFEIKGMWYLPNQTFGTDEVQGILRYSPQQIVLELIGTFGDRDPFCCTDKPSGITIYGFSDNGKWVTLLKCFPKKAHMHAPGFDTVSYIVNRFYIGTQLIEDEDHESVVDSLFSFTNLDAWLTYGGLHERRLPNEKRVEYINDYGRVFSEKAEVNIFSQKQKLIEELSYSTIYPKEFFLEEKVELIFNRFYRLKSSENELCSLNYAFDNIQRIRRLLALMLGIPMYYSYIEFTLPSRKEILGDGTEYEHKNGCKMFFNQVGDITKVNKLSRNTPKALLIRHSDIKACMEDVFNHWFEEQEEMSEITSAYINSLYLPTYMEASFLNIARGLETYHRCFVKDRKTQIEDRDEKVGNLEKERALIISYINNTIPAEDRPYFTERVCYENEESLRKRLTMLFNLTPPKLMSHLFGNISSKEKKGIINKIVDTRNYYTHRDSKTKYPHVINSNGELYALIDKLSVLLQFFCLSHIGIDADVVERRLIEHM